MFPLMLSSKSSYYSLIQSTSPVVYWPCTELAGVVVKNRSSVKNAEGSYIGPTLGNTPSPGIGRAPYFDGVNDFVDLYTASLNTVFNGQLGSLMYWFKVSAIGDWTEGVVRNHLRLHANGTNFISIFKYIDPNTLVIWYVAANVFTAVVAQNCYNADWNMLACTWSRAADRFILYINGSPIGDPLGSLGTWAGTLDESEQCVFGASTDVPNDPWHGHLAHPTLWDKVLTPTQVQSLYNGGV